MNPTIQMIVSAGVRSTLGAVHCVAASSEGSATMRGATPPFASIAAAMAAGASAALTTTLRAGRKLAIAAAGASSQKA